MSSDEALYERLIAGDLCAFDVLYARYERPLFGFIWRTLPVASGRGQGGGGRPAA